VSLGECNKIIIVSHIGEDVNGMSFEGADEELLRRALGILEDQGKCTMFKGDTSSEDGIKFF
jgi:ESCRT-II complex subunit VPS25